MMHVDIHIVPGSVAPRYEDWDDAECKLESVAITERGMASELPCVDFVFIHKKTGHRFVAVTSGRIVQSIAAAIAGINLRNHGKEQP